MNTVAFVTFQKNVIVHLYAAGATKCTRNSFYIDSYSMTYKEFYETKLEEFYFSNPCKDTLEQRLNKVKNEGFSITDNDDTSYKFKAVKNN